MVERVAPVAVRDVVAWLQYQVRDVPELNVHLDADRVRGDGSVDVITVRIDELLSALQVSGAGHDAARPMPGEHCPKCGRTNLEVEHGMHQYQIAFSCRTCSHFWREDTLDAPAAVGTAPPAPGPAAWMPRAALEWLAFQAMKLSYTAHEHGEAPRTSEEAFIAHALLVARAASPAVGEPPPPAGEPGPSTEELLAALDGSNVFFDDSRPKQGWTAQELRMQGFPVYHCLSYLARALLQQLAPAANVPCPDYEGKGMGNRPWTGGENPCPTCDGKGKVPAPAPADLVPLDADDGNAHRGQRKEADDEQPYP